MYHFVLDFAVLRGPGIEADLVPHTLVALFVFKVVHCVPALVGGQAFDKLFVRAALGYFVDVDLREVILDAVDDVFVFLLQLEVLEHLDTSVFNTNSARLSGNESFRKANGEEAGRYHDDLLDKKEKK